MQTQNNILKQITANTTSSSSITITQITNKQIILCTKNTTNAYSTTINNNTNIANNINNDNVNFNDKKRQNKINENSIDVNEGKQRVKVGNVMERLQQGDGYLYKGKEIQIQKQKRKQRSKQKQKIGDKIKKQYHIKYETTKQLQLISSIINKFSKKIGYVKYTNIHIYLQMCQQYKVVFDQLIIDFQQQKQMGNQYIMMNTVQSRETQALFKQYQQKFKMMQGIYADVYKFTGNLSVQRVLAIVHIINKMRRNRLKQVSLSNNRTIQVQFHMKINQMQQLMKSQDLKLKQLLKIVKIIDKWIDCHQKFQQQQQLSINEKHSIKQKQTNQFQLQKLSLYLDQNLLFTLEQKHLYGLSLCLYNHSQITQFLIQILKLFKNKKQKSKKFISLQFQDWQPSHIQPVRYIFRQYNHHQKYLIKFGNYLQITELRLFINTTGMKKEQVGKIMEEMKNPGHYQLICHSTKQYFEQAVKIFLYKPLIRFKYFVPLAEVQEVQGQANPFQVAIDVMVQKADLLRKKIQIFMNMLKYSYTNENFDFQTIIKLFYCMSQMTPK